MEFFMALIIKNKFIWDFWYLYNEKSKIFDVYFLNSDAIYAKNNQHHFHSIVGKSKTLDWINFFGFSSDFIHADDTLWANTSIWTGDTIKYGNKNAVFFTSRDRNELDGNVQHIGVAIVDIDGRVEMTEAKISATDGLYMTETDPKEKTIHCWRDPFIFESHNSVYMLVAAKRKDSPLDKRGCIALMELIDKNDLSKWKHNSTILSTDFSEVELPQIYKTNNESMRIFFNAKRSNGSRHFIMTDEFCFNGSDNFASNIKLDRDIFLEIYENHKYYGFRVIPENNNIISAFNNKLGCIEIVYNMASVGIGNLFSIKPNL